MKVNSATSQKNQTAAKKLSEEQVREKLASKFGKKIGETEKKEEDKVELSKSAQSKADAKVIDKDEVVIGDIGKNDPKDIVTQEKLKGLLRNGGFAFNEKERAALSKILKP